MSVEIVLSAEQHARVERKAAEMGITVAGYVRRLVDQDLGPVTSWTDPSAIFGLGRSGGSDIAAEGKEAVAEAIADFRRAPACPPKGGGIRRHER